VLVVRVIDTGGGGGIYGTADDMKVSIAEDQQVSLAGKWLYQTSTPLKDMAPAPRQMGNSQNRPTVLYNGMIAPLIPYAFKGAIWYQGESNASRAHQYQTLFPAMITDWRTQWKQGDFPFYFVQLAAYMPVNAEPVDDAWAELREAQLKTLSLPNTGMAVAIDIGDALDIHPKNKQDVGKRLALIALKNLYEQDIEFSGPMYESMEKNGKFINLHFKYAEGLAAKGGGKLKGFAVAGEDMKFFWADAVIEGDMIKVSSPKVSTPVAVRYAWSSNPVCNLINAAGLPASPFRTDDWQGVTFGAK